MADDVVRPRTSTRDPDELRGRLERWLAGRLAEDDVRVEGFEVPASNGLSSETVLFETAASAGGTERRESLVARLAPMPDAMPVFESYDLERQALVMRLVRERTALPVPEVRWSEPDPAPLGTPFFVMERIEGRVPPDLMPYNMLGWVVDASAAERAAMQEATVAVLASLSAIPEPTTVFGFLRAGPAIAGAGAGSDVSALRSHVAAQHAYSDWVAEGSPIPLVERMFAWLDEHWPAHEGPTVLSWGDARIGNVMYRDFTPVAVLDWEMAALGPPELDLGWLVFMHRYFEFVAKQYGLPGLPDFLRLDDVAGAFERASGYSPRDLDWYVRYAALRHAVIMARIQRRAIHFGEAAAPDDADDLIMHRLLLEELLAAP